VTAIKDILRKRVNNKKDPSKLLQLQIRTIDSYQGSENDIVLLSLTRNNPASAIGFMELAGRRYELGFTVQRKHHLLFCNLHFLYSTENFVF
jgi:hypothetical protein